MKTANLEGTQLDWAVAKCEGHAPLFDKSYPYTKVNGLWVAGFPEQVYYCPSTSWQQGGPIIEREMISVWSSHSAHFPNEQTNWQAGKKHFGKNHNAGRNLGDGPTPLIAAMRCYVASKLGDEIEIPKELL